MLNCKQKKKIFINESKQALGAVHYSDKFWNFTLFLQITCCKNVCLLQRAKKIFSSCSALIFFFFFATSTTAAAAQGGIINYSSMFLYARCG